MKKYPLFVISLISISIALSTSIKIQDIKDTHYIGEIINIELDLREKSPDKLFVQRDFDNKSVVVLDIKEIKEKPYHYLLRIAAFDTGYVDTGKIPIYSLKQGLPDTIFVEPFKLYIKTSLTVSDTLLKDIKPPVDFHLKFFDFLFPFLLLICIFLIVYLFRKFARREKIVERVVVDDRPAWMIVLELLEKLSKKRLLEDGHYVEFYFELSMILRFFLELQYKIKAVEMTTFEIKNVLPDIPSKKQIIKILSEMDKTKFAKFTPEFSDVKEILNWVEGYIRAFARDTNNDLSS